MELHECALCLRQRRAFSCAQCTSDMLQQRRTMLVALQADVAVLRKKTEFALNSKSALVDAEQRLDARMKQVERLTERVMAAREQLCSERIAVVEQTSALEQRAEQLDLGQQQAQREQQQHHLLQGPLLASLDLQVQWAHEHAARTRGDKIRELFNLFGLSPANEGGSGSNAHQPRVFFRTIASLPLPISGRYEILPPEVVAAAMGKVIHLLMCLPKYLQITYPHPMVFNGSFSTIGNTSEGAGCHTLYPDGTEGFERGVDMLHENVAFFCSSQGVSSHELHPTDLLGNLLCAHRSPLLGTPCDQTTDSGDTTPSKQDTQSYLGQSAFFPVSAQTMDASVEILPHYS